MSYSKLANSWWNRNDTSNNRECSLLYQSQWVRLIDVQIGFLSFHAVNFMIISRFVRAILCEKDWRRELLQNFFEKCYGKSKFLVPLGLFLRSFDQFNEVIVPNFRNIDETIACTARHETIFENWFHFDVFVGHWVIRTELIIFFHIIWLSSCSDFHLLKSDKDSVVENFRNRILGGANPEKPIFAIFSKVYNLRIFCETLSERNWVDKMFMLFGYPALV